MLKNKNSLLRNLLTFLQVPKKTSFFFPHFLSCRQNVSLKTKLVLSVFISNKICTWERIFCQTKKLSFCCFRNVFCLTWTFFLLLSLRSMQNSENPSSWCRTSLLNKKKVCKKKSCIEVEDKVRKGKLCSLKLKLFCSWLHLNKQTRFSNSFGLKQTSIFKTPKLRNFCLFIFKNVSVNLKVKVFFWKKEFEFSFKQNNLMLLFRPLFYVRNGLS